jgi:hypothetical protein
VKIFLGSGAEAPNGKQRPANAGPRKITGSIVVKPDLSGVAERRGIYPPTNGLVRKKSGKSEHPV